VLYGESLRLVMPSVSLTASLNSVIPDDSIGRISASAEIRQGLVIPRQLR